MAYFQEKDITMKNVNGILSLNQLHGKKESREKNHSYIFWSSIKLII